MSYDLTSLFSLSTAKNIFNESFRLGAPSISLVDDELVLKRHWKKTKCRSLFLVYNTGINARA